MRAMIFATLVALVGFGSVATATELDLTVEAMGCNSSEIVVGPACETPYRVVGELTDAASDGLSMIVFDLAFDGGGLPQADTPIALPMAAFAPPAGLSNPGGYGGTLFGASLVQVGGSQNVLVQGAWDCEIEDDCPAPSTCVDQACTAIPGLPLGTVVLGVAQPGAPATLVTGALTAPVSPGTYSLVLTHPVGNVIEKGAFGLPYWRNQAVEAGSIRALSITVESGRACCDVYEGCCLADDSCTFAEPAQCLDLGGMPNGMECDGDPDGDGVDGTCGDLCPDDPGKLAPGVCGCGLPDTDSDGDGTPDCVDGCPGDPNKTQPGQCGCGVPDTDSDGDLTADCNDGCPDDPNKTEPGACGCGVPDEDSDGDTVLDCVDVCPGQDDRVDENENGTPDCLESGGVPAVSNVGIVVTVLLLMGASWFVLRRRRKA